MILKTRGIPTKVDKALCKKALKWFGKTLFTEKTFNEIEIELSFDETDLEYEFGTTEWNDTNVRGRDFTITVDPHLGVRNMLITIAHEMVHVKQYATGQLIDFIHSSKANKCRWKGKITNNHDNPIKYWSSPWEIEAYGMEKGLYYRFLSENKRKKHKKR